MQDKIKQFAHILIILNLVDAIATLVWVHAGFSGEANPLMQLVEGKPFWFAVVKMTLVNLGVYALVLGNKKYPRVCSTALLLLTSFYLFVCIGHLGYFLGLVL